MVNEKLQINIPVSGMKNATQRRTRTFLCCSCLGAKESMSDSAITVTLGKYDDCEYVVEKLAIKRIPTKLLTHEEISPDKIEKNPSDTTTTQSTQLEDFEYTNKKKPTGITFSSYYKMVPNKLSPDKIPQMRERTESSIITLSDSKNQPKHGPDLNTECEGPVLNQHKTLERNYQNEWEFKKIQSNKINETIETDNETNNMLVRNDNKYFESNVEKPVVNIDPQTKKTLQILGGAPAGENIHRYYHNFSKGPIKCIGPAGLENKYLDIGEYQREPINMSVRNKYYNNDTDEVSTTSTSHARQGLKWKILIKHHDKNPRNSPPIESTTETCSDSEY